MNANNDNDKKSDKTKTKSGRIKAEYLIDEREPKEILRIELYLTAPMVRRILNCTYQKALDVIEEAQEIQRQDNMYIAHQKKKEVHVKAFKKLLNI